MNINLSSYQTWSLEIYKVSILQVKIAAWNFQIRILG